MLDAARESILAVGFRRTTLTEVARRAGVSRMTLYRRWPDMESMVADLMTRELTGLVSALVLDDDSPVERLVHGVVAITHAVRENPLMRRIVDVDPELLLPYLLVRRGRSQDLVLDLLVPLVREGQRTGEIRLGNAHVIARSIVLAGHGFVLSVATMTEPRKGTVGDFDRELGVVVRSFLRAGIDGSAS